MRFTQKHLDDYIGLILYCVKKHSATSVCSHYDMISSGKYGLAQALKSYDKSKKVPMKFWVYRFINSQIIKARYKNNKEYKEDNGLDETYNNLESPILPPIEQLMNNEIIDDNNEDLYLIKQVLNDKSQSLLTRNNGLNKNIYIDRYIKGMKITEISIKYQLSYASICHRISSVTNLIQITLGVKVKTKVNATKGD